MRQTFCLKPAPHIDGVFGRVVFTDARDAYATALLGGTPAVAHLHGSTRRIEQRGRRLFSAWLSRSALLTGRTPYATIACPAARQDKSATWRGYGVGVTPK